MRTTLVMACSVLVSVTAPASMIAVHSPKVKMMSSASVRTACNGSVDTACTKFESPELSCDCRIHKGRWTPAVRIGVRPMMYVSDAMYLEHELGHITDFQTTMRNHAADVEQHAFTLQTECERFAGETRANFGQVLREFWRESTLRRDGRLPDR